MGIRKNEIAYILFGTKIRTEHDKLTLCDTIPDFSEVPLHSFSFYFEGCARLREDVQSSKLKILPFRSMSPKRVWSPCSGIERRRRKSRCLLSFTRPGTALKPSCVGVQAGRPQADSWRSEERRRPRILSVSELLHDFAVGHPADVWTPQFQTRSGPRQGRRMP